MHGIRPLCLARDGGKPPQEALAIGPTTRTYVPLEGRHFVRCTRLSLHVNIFCYKHPVAPTWKGKTKHMDGAWHASSSGLSPPYWLIMRSRASRLEVLTVARPGGDEILPIFSQGESALVFLQLCAAKGGWQVRQTRVGELISILHGPCAQVSRIVLNPSAETLCGDTGGPAGMRRASFVDALLGRGRPWFDAGYGEQRKLTKPRHLYAAP